MSEERAFEPVIGLEVHVQLATRSKLFCACPARSFGAPPNTHICPVCTGQPGVLPVTNRKAVELGVRAALALGCQIRERSIFARKNYFYPDLPKGYQISQYEEPFSEKGRLEIAPGRIVGIHRIHLEEDAGKLLHAIGSEELPYSLVDLNRAGIPLLEIVSEPELFSPEEAYEYLTALKQILQYTGVSSCDMEKGEMRCDANISLRARGSKTYGTRCEIKNLNSFKAVRAALRHEIGRQMRVLEGGGVVVQETRLWDEASQSTAPMRSKEEAHDYRYFPEPDLVPLVVDRAWLEEIRRTLPETPKARQTRLMRDFALSEYDSSVLTSSRETAELFEKALAAYLKETPETDRAAAAKLLANWIINQHAYASREAGITDFAGLDGVLAAVVSMSSRGVISAATGKDILLEAYRTGKHPRVIVEERGAARVSDESRLKAWATEAVAENQKAAQDYRSGKESALGRIVGAVMKKSKGKADPAAVNRILKEILKP